MSVQQDILAQVADNAVLASNTLRHLLFPRDFELYMCGLELTDFYGETIDYFIFPVMPNSINKTENERTTLYKTFGGLTVLNSDSFTPQQLTISGNFGRTFKIVLKNNLSYSFIGAQLSIESGKTDADSIGKIFSLPSLPFLPMIKTGYGCTKILQSIISKAKGNNKGKPFRLYFYNPALSESYLVTPTKQPLVLSQEVNSNNAMWNYTLNLDIIAPLDNIVFDVDVVPKINTFLAAAAIQAAVGSLASKVSGF